MIWAMNVDGLDPENTDWNEVDEEILQTRIQTQALMRGVKANDEF